jgi:3-hydroxyacyl-[acyl-carrier-protein] dehydratase
MELNTFDIMQLLPHRYPFLLVDKIIEFIKDEQIVGVKNVTINEPFFQGHFPGHPIMPGVLILEAMAQVGGVYAILANEVGENQVPYFVGIDKAKFRKPVLSGDVLKLSLELQKVRRGIYYFLGKAMVDGKLVAEAELKATFADK